MRQVTKYVTYQEFIISFTDLHTKSTSQNPKSKISVPERVLCYSVLLPVAIFELLFVS